MIRIRVKRREEGLEVAFVLRTSAVIKAVRALFAKQIVLVKVKEERGFGFYEWRKETRLKTVIREVKENWKPARPAGGLGIRKLSVVIPAKEEIQMKKLRALALQRKLENTYCFFATLLKHNTRNNKVLLFLQKYSRSGGFRVKHGMTKTIATVSIIALLFQVAGLGAFASISSASANGGDPSGLCEAAVDVVLVMDRSGSMAEGESVSKCEWSEKKKVEGEEYSIWFLNVKHDVTEQWCMEIRDEFDESFPFIDKALTYTPATNSKIVDAKAAANTFLGYLGVNDQSGLVSFADDALLNQELTGSHNDTQNAVNGLVTGGATNIGDAIAEGTAELGSERANLQAVKVMILLTDGKANMPNGVGDPELYAEGKAGEAAALGYKIFTIGLGSNVNSTMLQNIAAITQADYHYAPTSADLEGIYESIRWRICQFGSISGCKYSDVDKDGDESDFSGEDTISEWEIILTGGANGPVEQQTDQNGCYSFTGLNSGTYTISEGIKAGVENFEQTYPISGSYTNIILNEGDNLENYDFGNYLPVCGNGILDENYYSYNEECDEQAGVGEHQSCSNECILIDLTYCGDGILQSPNEEGTGGPQNDGYEQCDGQDGISGSQICSNNCIIEEDIPVCQASEVSRECFSDGFTKITYEYYPIGCDDNYTEIEDDTDCACVETEAVGECVDESSREFTYTYNYDYCGTEYSEIREDKTCGEEPVYQCSDGTDNDGDGFIDYPDDPGCDSLEDNDEYHAYCGDGVCNNNETCSTCPQDCGSCGGGGGAVITKPSITIINENVIYLGGGEALVTWTTNIETTRQVAYGDDSISSLGSAPKYGYDSVNEESASMTKDHSVMISGLTDGVIYYFRPVADRFGSTGEVVGDEVFYELGEVKGIEAPEPAPIPEPVECNYLFEYIKLGADNNPVEVEKLERFLNEFEGENLPINGIYEQVDFDAVSRFQEKYLGDILSPWSHNKATGYVYITTKKKINELYCQRAFPLTAEQEAEVLLFSKRSLDPGSAEAFGGEDPSIGDTDVSGRVGGVKDEATEETETEERLKEEPEGEEEAGEPAGGGTLLIGEEDKDGTQEDGSIIKAFKDFNKWIWLIVIIVIGIVIYSFSLIAKRKKKKEQ